MDSKVNTPTLKIEDFNRPANYEILGIRPYSAVPGDHYLSIVLAKSEVEYVVWTYNWEDRGCHHGFYTKDLQCALDEFEERGKPHIIEWMAEVKVQLERGATAESAEIDPEQLKTHRYQLDAHCRKDAIERALDKFHMSIPIGVLDDVHIECEAKRKVYA